MWAIVLLTDALGGCAQSVPVSSTPLVDAAADSSATSGATPAGNPPVNTSSAPTTATPPVPPVTPPPDPDGTATLTWVGPTSYTDGTPLSNLAGYHLYYGTGAGQLNEEVIVIGAGPTTYVLNGLTSGTYYFSVTAISSEGVESARSNLASKSF